MPSLKGEVNPPGLQHLIMDRIAAGQNDFGGGGSNRIFDHIRRYLDDVLLAVNSGAGSLEHMQCLPAFNIKTGFFEHLESGQVNIIQFVVGQGFEAQSLAAALAGVKIAHTEMISFIHPL